MELQTTWFILIFVLLAGYSILDGFDLGVGILSLAGGSEEERRLRLKAIGPVWDGNEVWLLTGGGALFAAFPPVYASVFSAFYLALTLLLVALIFRALAIELRNKEAGKLWRGFWDLAFGLGSLVATLLLGVAMGNVLQGLSLSPCHEYDGPFLGLLGFFPLLTGLFTVALFTMHGAMYLHLKTEGTLEAKAERVAKGMLFLVGVIYVAAATLFYFDAAPLETKIDSIPLRFGLVVLPLIFLFPARSALLKKQSGRAFLYSALFIATIWAVAAYSLFPMLLPASNAEKGLSIFNASSTPLTLQTMLTIALIGMPLVILYTAVIYWIFRGKVKLDGSGY